MTAGSVSTALIYTRVSSDDQAREGLSLEMQIAECRRYAANQGWTLGNEYQDILKGTRDDRPYYQALLADVRRARAAGDPIVVVVLRLDRFGRRLLERVRCREELKALGVSIYSVREGGEVSDIVANVLAAVAQDEVRVLGERVSDVRQRTSARGWYFPGVIPWGYRFREATAEERREGAPKSVLVVDDDEASFARQAFARAAAGETMHAVARWVQALPASVRGGRHFGGTAVRHMLQNPVYVARPKSGAPDVLDRPVGRWPPLVGDDAFAVVRDRIAGHVHMPRQASGRYLLTGLVRCPCGGRMAGNTLTKQAPRYRCRGYHRGASAPDASCRGTALVSALDALVLEQVIPVVEAVATDDAEQKRALRAAWRALTTRTADDTTPRVRKLEQQAERFRNRLRTGARLMADGEMDRRGYELMRDEASADLEATEAELATLRAQRPMPVLPDLDGALAEAGGWRAVLSAAEVGGQRDLLGILVEHVVPVRVSKGAYRAEIVWTPYGAGLRAIVAAAGLSRAA